MAVKRKTRSNNIRQNTGIHFQPLLFTPVFLSVTFYRKKRPCSRQRKTCRLRLTSLKQTGRLPWSSYAGMHLLDRKGVVLSSPLRLLATHRLKTERERKSFSWSEIATITSKQQQQQRKPEADRQTDRQRNNYHRTSTILFLVTSFCFTYYVNSHFFAQRTTQKLRNSQTTVRRKV